VDGSGVSMPDTPENQGAYPQPSGQARGLGFPVACIVVVLSLACGAVLGAAVGRTEREGGRVLKRASRVMCDSVFDPIRLGKPPIFRLYSY
jgi:hypothetical protein